MVFQVVDDYLNDFYTSFENTIDTYGWTNPDGLGSTDLSAFFLRRINEYYIDRFNNNAIR